jgi:hypothetical protein
MKYFLNRQIGNQRQVIWSRLGIGSSYDFNVDGPAVAGDENRMVGLYLLLSLKSKLSAPF